MPVLGDVGEEGLSLLTICIVTALLTIGGMMALDHSNNAHAGDNSSNARAGVPRGRGGPPPPARGSPSVHDAVMDSYYKHRKGGAVVHCGKRFMLAVEFNAPARAGRAIEADMVYVDKNPQARAVVQARRCGSAKELGAAFLRGEEFEYMEVDEAAFFDLLKRYKRSSKTEGLIDMGSGLRMYNVTLIR